MVWVLNPVRRVVASSLPGYVPWVFPIAGPTLGGAVDLRGGTDVGQVRVVVEGRFALFGDPHLAGGEGGRGRAVRLRYRPLPILVVSIYNSLNIINYKMLKRS